VIHTDAPIGEVANHLEVLSGLLPGLGSRRVPLPGCKLQNPKRSGLASQDTGGSIDRLSTEPVWTSLQDYCAGLNAGLGTYLAALCFHVQAVGQVDGPGRDGPE
jgi:hypothetical protein